MYQKRAGDGATSGHGAYTRGSAADRRRHHGRATVFGSERTSPLVDDRAIVDASDPALALATPHTEIPARVEAISPMAVMPPPSSAIEARSRRQSPTPTPGHTRQRGGSSSRSPRIPIMLIMHRAPGWGRPVCDGHGLSCERGRRRRRCGGGTPMPYLYRTNERTSSLLLSVRIERPRVRTQARSPRDSTAVAWGWCFVRLFGDVSSG